MKLITSAQNPRLKAAIRLKTSRGRKTQQRVIIFGVRELLRAMDSGLRPLEVFMSTEVLADSERRELESHLASGVEVYDLPAKLFCKLQYGEREEGVVAIAQRPKHSLDDLELPAKSLVVVLEGVEKPGNLGAVIRSMDGAGAHALILADATCDAYHPNSVRASLGTAFSIPLAIGTSIEVKRWLAAQKFAVHVATDSASACYTEVDFRDSTAIVLGEEARGLSEAWIGPNLSKISIPMTGIADSLNVSVAAGVLLYEAHRQRRLA